MEFNPFKKKPQENKNESSSIVIKPKLGDNVDEFIDNLIEVSKDRDVIGYFGMTDEEEQQIEFKIPRGTHVTPDGLRYFYYEKQAEKTKKYYNSSEYKKESEISRQEFQRDQEETNRLIKELPNINFDDPEMVLEWIKNFDEVVNEGVGFYRDDVLDVFVRHGYTTMFSNMEIGDFSSTEDKEKIAKIIVGKALDSIVKTGHLRSYYITGPLKKWKEKFGNKN